MAKKLSMTDAVRKFRTWLKKYDSEWLNESLSDDLRSGGEAWKLSISVGAYKYWTGTRAIDLVYSGDTVDGWGWMQRCAQAQGLNATIIWEENVLRDPASSLSASTVGLHETLLGWLMAVGMHETPYSIWFGKWLLRAAQGGPRFMAERAWTFSPLTSFCFRLYAAWQHEESLAKPSGNAEWQPFEDLFQDWNQPEKVAQALVRIADYHASHTREGILGGFDGKPFPIFPVEILAVLRVRRELGLETPPVDHPLVSGNPLFDVPEVLPQPAAIPTLEAGLAALKNAYPKLMIPWG